MLASSALNNLFVTYHLDFYLTVVRLRPSYFYLGHAVFMVWNAVNDVLFGWLSDTLPLSRGGRRSRLPAIRVGGALWAAAFLLSWYPWSCALFSDEKDGAAADASFAPSLGQGGGGGVPLTHDDDDDRAHETSTGGWFGGWWVSSTSTRGAPLWLNGINFTLNLCVYDAMLTLVEVNHHALLAEISVDSRERARYNSWSSICAAVGSLTSWLGHCFWNKDDLRPFRTFALSVAFVCWGFFEGAARQLAVDPHYSRAAKRHDGSGKAQSDDGGGGSSGGGDEDNSAPGTGASSGYDEHAFDGGGGGGTVTKRRLRQQQQQQQRSGGSSNIHQMMPSSSSSSNRSSSSSSNNNKSTAKSPAVSGMVSGLTSAVAEFRRQGNFVIFAGVSALQTFDCVSAIEL